MKTFVVTERRKYLAAHELGAITVTKFHAVAVGHPSFNQRLSMTEDEALNFNDMLKTGAKMLVDNTGMKIITYTITEE